MKNPYFALYLDKIHSHVFNARLDSELIILYDKIVKHNRSTKYDTKVFILSHTNNQVIAKNRISEIEDLITEMNSN